MTYTLFGVEDLEPGERPHQTYASLVNYPYGVQAPKTCRAEARL